MAQYKMLRSLFQIQVTVITKKTKEIQWNIWIKKSITQAAENKDGKKEDETKIKKEGQMQKQEDHDMELGQRKMISYILATNCTC